MRMTRQRRPIDTGGISRTRQLARTAARLQVAGSLAIIRAIANLEAKGGGKDGEIR